MRNCATGSTVRDADSPYWLRLNGIWTRLEGVAPGSTRTPERPRSEFITVGGYRHVQQAPRAPRTWEMNFEYATPEALRAIEVAAEAVGSVLLWDESAAAANMLKPRETMGLDPTAYALDIGGIALPEMSSGAITAVLKPGEYVFSLWTRKAPLTALGTLKRGTNATENIVAPAGLGAKRFVYPFISAVDENFVVTITGEVTGLQLVEGIFAPALWAQGQQTPVTVSVEDPSQTLDWIWRRPRGMAYGDWPVTVKEVYEE